LGDERGLRMSIVGVSRWWVGGWGGGGGVRVCMSIAGEEGVGEWVLACVLERKVWVGWKIRLRL
jgi:hypothetical protein